jgi:CheY-like chemotaxis protein
MRRLDCCGKEPVNALLTVFCVVSSTFCYLRYMASTEKQLLGTETVKELRSRSVKSTICGLSANNMEQAFMSAGADFFILKPFPCNKSALECVLGRLARCRSELG